MKKKILQIITAEGWVAHHETELGPVDIKLICWALVEYEDGSRGVEGMSALNEDEALCFETESKSFHSYLYSVG